MKGKKIIVIAVVVVVLLIFTIYDIGNFRSIWGLLYRIYDLLANVCFVPLILAIIHSENKRR